MCKCASVRASFYLSLMKVPWWATAFGTTAQQYNVSYAVPTSTKLRTEHGLLVCWVVSERLPPNILHDGRHRPTLLPHCGYGCCASPHVMGAQQCGVSKATPSDSMPARTQDILRAVAPFTPAPRLAQEGRQLPPRGPQLPFRCFMEVHGLCSSQNRGSPGRGKAR